MVTCQLPSSRKLLDDIKVSQASKFPTHDSYSYFYDHLHPDSSATLIISFASLESKTLAFLHPFSKKTARSSTMAPKQRITVAPGSRRHEPQGYFGSAYSTITDPENASVVRSVAIFGVSLLSICRIYWGSYDEELHGCSE
jgi:hypothetical protein